jgi:hypothetical protein
VSGGATRLWSETKREASAGTPTASINGSQIGAPPSPRDAPAIASAAHSAITFSAATVATRSMMRPCRTVAREAGAQTPPGR